jgi:hypothetical protein
VSATQLWCPDDARRDALRDLADPNRNAIDWLEVLPSKRALIVHCVADLPSLDRDNVEIAGGVRVTPIGVLSAARADELAPGLLTADDQAVVAALPAPVRALVVRTDSSGDYSTYTLRVRHSTLADEPPAGFDRLLCEVDFSFKVDCPSDFDCRDERECADETGPAPRLDYLAKDFASFRRMMLDRLTQTIPQWTERNPVDLGIALVEVMAYVGDQLSYQQDAVATEAYLGTARRRASVRRHARLVDYRMHDGANARTWIHLRAAQGKPAVPSGTRIVSAGGVGAGTRSLEEAVAAGATVFETMHDADLDARANDFELHTWGDPNCCLPRGATRATLVAPNATFTLAKGTVLVLEELVGGNDEPPDREIAHRHVVRLKADSVKRTDTLPSTPVRVLEVEWYDEDALPFALRLGLTEDGDRRALAHGNMVLADHGLTVSDDPVVVPERGQFRPVLRRRDVTQAVQLKVGDAVRQPARRATDLDLDTVLPAVRLAGEDDTWRPARDLIGSDRFTPEFVVETEADGSATLRFGNDVRGRRPRAGAQFTARYRIGSGPAGNVGADTLTEVVMDSPDPNVGPARNPLPATGGTLPEPIEQVRLYAPQAFRRQERAVTEDDYARVAETHPGVQRAAATRRWTGSWHTMFVTIDRLGSETLDAQFEDEIARYLDRFRLAGYDVEIDAPRLVPLDLIFDVCVAPDYVRSDIKRALLDLFSARDLGAGRRGLFHPDEFTFAQPVRLSPLIAAAMRVPGVRRVTPVKFERFGVGPHGELAAGQIAMERLEIAQLENDPSRLEAGRIDFTMEGGE